MDDTTPGADKPGPAEHLKAHRFEKGRSGNPGGRPKGRGVTAALRELGESEHNGALPASAVPLRRFPLVGVLPDNLDIVHPVQPGLDDGAAD